MANRVLTKIGFFALAAAAAGADLGPAQAAGRGLQTWLLVCPKSLGADDCNLTTADKWFHMATPQPSASSPAIKAAKKKLEAEIDSNSYVNIEQFPVGVSIGPYSAVFKACETRSDAPAPSGEAAVWAARGGCLQ